MNVFAVYRKILRISNAVIGKPSLPNFFIARPNSEPKLWEEWGGVSWKNVDKIKNPHPFGFAQGMPVARNARGMGHPHE